MANNKQREDEPCLQCDGTGNEHNDCDTCGGDGWLEDPSDGGTMTCDECGGHEDCTNCDGDGYVNRNE